MTSLNLPGFSLTLLLLPREPQIPEQSKFETEIKFNKELVLECLDDQTDAPGWKWMYKGKPEMKSLDDEDEEKEKKKKKEILSEENEVRGPKR